MYIAELRIENFRLFGEEENSALIKLRPGLTALIGENDSGKTAIVDALRLALGTRDQEYLRVEESDFHSARDGSKSTEIRIRCKFDGLSTRDSGAFAEYLTYEEREGSREPVLYLTWKAAANVRPLRQRRFVSVEVRSGIEANGPAIDPEARNLLCSTYLRPLRDAERALSAGRGSRLSQILQYTEEVTNAGVPYNDDAGPPDDLGTLSVLGIGDMANALLKQHTGLTAARDRLNNEYLKNLSFSGSELAGELGVAIGDGAARLRQLLEKLEIQLQETGADHLPRNRGLGSNNILFMACELLLLGSEEDGFPFLLIEEPEAHLHPQRQLRLMKFLQDKANQGHENESSIQILITTHSPNLTSAIDLDNIVLLADRKAFSLARGHTALSESDYRFLQRFLDVTKSNLFFARGVAIVEGDAENILLPTLAKLIGRDFTENGVSIVNVGGVGLRRYARIFQRKNHEDEGQINMPVACLADRDVMPDCAPAIIGKMNAGDKFPDSRRWKIESDFAQGGREEYLQSIRDRASGQRVKTFISDYWTFEYDLALGGLGKELFLAVKLADADDRIASRKVSEFLVTLRALREWRDFSAEDMSSEERATRIYEPLAKGNVSKTIAAQYLARILMRNVHKDGHNTAHWRERLPPYIINSIDYATALPADNDGGVDGQIPIINEQPENDL